jgi:POT family proton-dependent oligopeptide transporter
MPKTPYRTAPVPSTEMPGGVPYIVGNEAAERFSYYGMKGILVVYMTQYLLAPDGSLELMGKEEANAWYHTFSSANYFFPILGAIVSDAFLGKYRTIIILSLVYCLGHLALFLDETRLGLAVGLALIAVGSGGIKPCVSAHVGDQFGRSNEHLLDKVFGWFYLSINLGAGLSTIVTPLLLDDARFGPQWAFGLPGVLMLIATVVFWAGRHKFVHVPPAGLGFVREAFSGEGLRAAGKLGVLYLFVAMFWALYDQTGSAWVNQAKEMDRHVRIVPETLMSDAALDDSASQGWLFREYEILPSQVQTINPILILIFVPLSYYVLFPAAERFMRVTAMRKIVAGFFLTVGAFSFSAVIESWIAAGAKPHIAWQGLAYVILTAAEVLVYQTCLEFSYTQAPRKMKSFIMALFLLSVSLGNGLTAVVNVLIQNADGTSKLPGASYYWFFAGLMLVTALVFCLYARGYREERYLQDEASAAA